MRNLTICDIRLHPSTVVSTFEEAMAGDVMLHAGDPDQPPATLFVRSLYRGPDEAFPPVYRCVVDSTWVTDAGFFRMRDRVRDLGADPGEGRFRPLAGNLPDDQAALDVLRSGRYRTMVMLVIHLPFGQDEQAFEKALLAALKDVVGRRTRVNNIYAAFWTKDDEVVSGNTEYLVAALGDFMEPELSDDTLAPIRAAGGDVVQSRAWLLIGTVPGPDPVLNPH
jgi:hypothetical protein